MPVPPDTKPPETTPPVRPKPPEDTPPATPPADPATPPADPKPPESGTATTSAAPTPPTTPDPEPPIDPEKMESSISEKVSKSVIDKLAIALGIKKEEKKEIPTDPDKLDEYIQQKANETFEAKLKERDDAATQTETDKQKQIKTGAETFQKMWARDYAEMANLGMVPKIDKADDTNDLGNVAKSRILLKLKELITENEKLGEDQVPSLWEVMQRFPNIHKTETVTGSNAPITGGGGAPTSQPSDYARIHNTPIEVMVADKHKS